MIRVTNSSLVSQFQSEWFIRFCDFSVTDFLLKLSQKNMTLTFDMNMYSQTSVLYSVRGGPKKVHKIESTQIRKFQFCILFIQN